MPVTRRTLVPMLSTVTSAPERRLVLDGGGACRDLGGYLTRSGAVVRWRAILRWDSASPPDARAPFALVDVAMLTLPATFDAIAAASGSVLLHSTTSSECLDDVAAMLLGVLGVGDDDVARDYALSTSGADIRPWLRDIRIGHGSMTGYATDLGVDLAVITQLRDRLLI
jgi:hypothetical protein